MLSTNPEFMSRVALGKSLCGGRRDVHLLTGQKTTIIAIIRFLIKLTIVRLWVSAECDIGKFFLFKYSPIIMY